jgi:hypothetical protein
MLKLQCLTALPTRDWLRCCHLVHAKIAVLDCAAYPETLDGGTRIAATLAAPEAWQATAQVGKVDVICRPAKLR